MASTWKMQLRRALAASALCGVMVAPLSTSISQAAPSDQAPTQGYRRDRNTDGGYRDRDRDGVDDRRDRDDDNDGVDDRYDTDYDNSNGGNGNGQRTVITGIVVRDVVGDAFTVREDGTGRTILVELVQGDEPQQLSRGDRVRVRGALTRNNVLRARRVQVLNNRDGNDGNSSRRTLTGVVTRDLSGSRFELRADNGQTYTVRLTISETERLTRGDRVRVIGDLRNERDNGRPLFVATRITFLQDRNGGNGGNRQSFTGVVQRERDNDRFELRQTNGRVLRVEPSSGVDLSSHNNGDLVRVEGYVQGDRLIANNLRVIGNGGNYALGQRVDFRGTVVGVNESRQIQVRGDNGRLYEVRISSGTRFRRSQRVHVRGVVRYGYTQATSIDRI